MAPHARRAAEAARARSYRLQHRLAAVVALEDRGRGHPHDRRVLTAVGAHRGELEAVQAVDAAVEAWEVRWAQPGLTAVRATRPGVDGRPRGRAIASHG